MTGTPLAPLLARDPDAAASIFIRSGEQGFTLQRTPTGWTIAERGGFPVNAARIDAFLRRLAGLRHGEPKTSDPGKLEELGLGDPFLGGSGSLVAVRNVTGALIAEFILGRRGESLFVRALDISASFAVATESGESPAENLALSRISDWLDFSVLTLDSARLVRVEIAPEGGEAYVLEPEKPTQAGPGTATPDTTVNPQHFVFARPWARLKPLANRDLDDIGRALDRFEPIDVIASGKLTGRALTRRRSVTADGLVIDAFPVQENGRYWVKLAALSIDPASAAEAGAINNRVEGWAFGLAPAAWAMLAPRLADLVETKAGTGPVAAPSGGQGGPAAGPPLFPAAPGATPRPASARNNAAPNSTPPGPAATPGPAAVRPETATTKPAQEVEIPPDPPPPPPG